MELITLEIDGFDQLQRENPETLDLEWVDFFARLDGPVRLLSLPAPFDLEPALEQIQEQLGPLEARERALEPLASALDAWEMGVTPNHLAELLTGLPPVLRDELAGLLGDRDRGDEATWARALDALAQPLWRIGPLRSYRQELRGYASHNLRGLRHFLLAWLPPGARPAHLIRAVEDTFDTHARETALPSILPGTYTDQPDYLQPDDPRHPHVAFLTAYDRQGRWSPDILHRALQLTIDVALCIDAKTVDRSRAAFLVDHTEVASRSALEEQGGPRNVRAERKHASAYELQAALATQQLHELRIVLAVFGSSPDELDGNVRIVEQAFGKKLSLMRPSGAQRALEQFFRPLATDRIASPVRPRFEPSRGLAVSVPFGVRKPSEAQGIEFLRSGTTPLMFDLFVPGRAAHAFGVGLTGIGKTVSLSCWARRLAALEGVQIVLYEPLGKGAALARSCGAGARHLILDTRQRANPLDVVVSRGAEGEPPPLLQQVEHVTTRLGVLLGTNVGGGETIIPRPWTSEERGVLTIAIADVYAPWEALDQIGLEETPTLADLCDALSSLATAEAQDDPATARTATALAREIHLRLVRGPYSTMFQGTTTIEWQLDRFDVLAYDFSKVPAGYLQTIYYDSAFGALLRHLYDPQRDRRRPVLGIIDEYGIMARVPGMRAFVASYMKHARNYNGHLWLFDQDYHRIDAGDDDSQSIVTNSPIRFFMRQESKNARRIADTIDGIRPHHVHAIQRAKVGECVLSWKPDGSGGRAHEVVIGRVVPTAEEWSYFGTGRM